MLLGGRDGTSCGHMCSDNPHSFVGESQILTNNGNDSYRAYVSYLAQRIAMRKLCFHVTRVE